jgi:hypothetical protein
LRRGTQENAQPPLGRGTIFGFPGQHLSNFSPGFAFDSRRRRHGVDRSKNRAAIRNEGIAFFGTINPTIGDIGVHIPLEQAVLAGGTSDSERTSIFARYGLVGALSIAAGSLVAGLPDALVSFGMAKGGALRIMFYVYAALGLLGAVFYSFLPRTEMTRAPSKSTGLGPSRKTIYKLAALFSLDAFASGFVVQSLMALWLFERFQLSLAAASAFFFCSNILAAFSYLVAARLGKHFGLVNTMVFTHIPASIV